MKEWRLKLPFYIILLFFAGIIGYNIWLANIRKIDIPGVIETKEQLATLVKGNIVNYKSRIHCQLAFDPREMDYDELFGEIIESDTYIGCQMYEVAYDYRVNGSIYDVNFRFKDPAPHRTFFTKLRVKQIADEVRDYSSDYAKVKAVHDYLIVLNEYTITMSGAFNTLYTGRSCCNGYAYSFYAIMEELGIPATCEFGGHHAWNRVFLDGEWYNIDVTWDDAEGRNARYDYFLKCDADWNGHVHGGATASKSMEVTGLSAYQNYKAIPNYQIILPGMCIVIAVVVFVIYRICKRRKELKDLFG